MKAKRRSAQVEIEHDCGPDEALDALIKVADALGLHVKQRDRDTSVVLTITRGVKPIPHDGERYDSYAARVGTVPRKFLLDPEDIAKGARWKSKIKAWYVEPPPPHEPAPNYHTVAIGPVACPPGFPYFQRKT